MLKVGEHDANDEHKQGADREYHGDTAEVAQDHNVAQPDIPGARRDGQRDRTDRENGECDVQPEHKPVGERHAVDLSCGPFGSALDTRLVVVLPDGAAAYPACWRRVLRKSVTTYSPRLSGIARSTRPPFRLATSSTNADSRSSSASMNTFIVARRLVILSTSAKVSSSVSGDGGQSNQNRPSRRRCAVGSPSVMTITTGLCSGRRSRNRPASTSAWCRLVPCTMSQVSPASL